LGPDIAVALDGPFVVLLQEDAVDQPNDGLVTGEDADNLAATFVLAGEPFKAVGGPKFRPVPGKIMWPGTSVSASSLKPISQRLNSSAAMNFRSSDTTGRSTMVYLGHSSR
jgi:hypothetical protein